MVNNFVHSFENILVEIEFSLNFMILCRVNWEESIAKTNSTVNNRLIDNTTSNTKPWHSTDRFISISQERHNFLIVYTIIMIFGTICYLSRSFSFFHMCIRISINLHDMIFRGVSRATMAFFNNNPSGRILNRFARDINSVDSMLPKIMVDILDVSHLNPIWNEIRGDFNQIYISSSY